MWDLRTIIYQNTPEQIKKAQAFARALNNTKKPPPTPRAKLEARRQTKRQ